MRQGTGITAGVRSLELAAPYALALGLLALPLLWLLLRQRRGGGVALPTAAGVAGLGPTLRLRLARLLPLVLAIAVVLAAIGIARPQIGDANAKVPAQGTDIVLSMDLSSSMSTAFGGEKSRLAVTREVAHQFVEGRKDDRIGLVVFELQSLAYAAPTLDHKALAQIIDGLNTGILPDGTAIGLGIAEAVNMLRDSTAASRTIILLTDGEHNARSISPEDATKLAASLHIRLYTIGLTDKSGPTGVDGARLTRIAESTGGKYFAASDPDTLKQVYDEIGRLETSAVGREHFERFTELAPWFLGGAATLLAVYLLLAGTWLRVSRA